jgi:hypothetical protein
MADDQVVVELVAKVDQLQSGLTQAVEALRSAVDSIKSDTHELAETSKETENALEKMLSMETFDFAKERLTEFFELMKEGFESTIVHAEEFSLSNAKFAAMMGTSETEAAGLSAALRGVGSSSEQYESMALRLEMRLKTMEPAMNQMGIATRDASGQLLGGNELMQNALSAMQGYKAGTDQNAFALEVFGRKAADVYDLIRVSQEDVEHQIDLYKEMGVTLEGTGSDAQQFESGMNDLHTILEALEVKIGQQLMPVMITGFEWLGQHGPELLGEVEKKVEELSGGIIKLTNDFMSFVGAVGKTISWFDKMGDLADKLDDPRNEHGLDTLKQMGEMIMGIGQDAGDAAGHVDGLAASWDSLKAAIAGATDYGDHGESLGMSYEAGNPYKKSGGSKRFTAPKKGGGRDNSADTEIKDDEKLQLERVSAEEATNQHLLSMGQETVETFVAQQRQLEDERYAIQSAALEKELALPNRTKAERQKTNDEIKLLEQTHVDALLKIDQDGESRRAALAKEQLANELRADDERLKSGIAALQEQANLGQISLAQRDAQEMELTQTVRREQLARLDGELATLTPGTKAYEDVVKQKEKIEKQFTADLKAENAQRARDVEASVKTWVTPMTSGFKTAISDMIVHGKSFSDAMTSMGDAILSGFVDLCLQLAEHWLILQITNAAVAQSTQASLGVAQVTSNAAVGAAGAAASQAAIPLVGPVLAATAAAETFSMIMGYSPIASAAGGMVLDRDQLVFAHTQEMILPSSLSSGLKSMIESGGGGGNSFAFHNTINAPQQATLSQMLSSQGDAMMAWINQKSRDGAFRRR